MASKPHLGLIEYGWILYRGSVMPKTTPPEQDSAHKRAFMAGAAHAFSLVWVITSDKYNDDESTSVIERILAELQSFANE